MKSAVGFWKDFANFFTDPTICYGNLTSLLAILITSLPTSIRHYSSILSVAPIEEFGHLNIY